MKSEEKHKLNNLKFKALLSEGKEKLQALKEYCQLFYELNGFYPHGLEIAGQGLCAINNCAFCLEGHLLECHAGKSCKDANCFHYQRESYEYERDARFEYQGSKSI